MDALYSDFKYFKYLYYFNWMTHSMGYRVTFNAKLSYHVESIWINKFTRWVIFARGQNNQFKMLFFFMFNI